MPPCRVLGYYDSRARWLQSTRLPELDRIAVEELAYLIPPEEEVLKTFAELRESLEPRSIACALVEAGSIDFLARQSREIGGGTVCWNMTDGFFPVTASYYPALCAMFGWRYFGNSASLQLAVQDKYLQYAMCRLLEIRTPETYLYDGARCLNARPPPDGKFAFFVKPFDLANSIGIFNDSVCETLAEAVAIAVRIRDHYHTKSLIQRYVPGDTLRVNYVAADRSRAVEDVIGIHRMKGPPEPDRPFSTFAAHFEDFAQADADYAREAVAVRLDRGPEAERLAPVVAQIKRDVAALAAQFGLRDFFSMDYKLTADGDCYFIEVNTLPFARNAGLRAYCREAFGLTVGGALAEAIITAKAVEFPREW
jgi:D-alanine-D-alanine ligase-like ATP-grasp enzyme